MFNFNFRKKKETGAVYRYPLYRYFRGMVGESLVIASFSPANVNGFGVLISQKGGKRNG